MRKLNADLLQPIQHTISPIIVDCQGIAHLKFQGLILKSKTPFSLTI